MSIEQDAARYRWLRENITRLIIETFPDTDGTMGRREIVTGIKLILDNDKWPAKPSTVDEAVDKAMAEDAEAAFMKCFDSL